MKSINTSSFEDARLLQQVEMGYSYWGLGPAGLARNHAKQFIVEICIILLISNKPCNILVALFVVSAITSRNSRSSKSQAIKQACSHLLALHYPEGKKYFLPAYALKARSEFYQNTNALYSTWKNYIQLYSDYLYSDCPQLHAMRELCALTFDFREGVIYTLRGAGFYSEICSIIDCLAFCIVNRMKMALALPCKSMAPARASMHYYLQCIYEFLNNIWMQTGFAFVNLSSSDLSEKDSNSSFKFIHLWQRSHNYDCFNVEGIGSIPLFIIRSLIIRAILPIDALLKYISLDDQAKTPLGKGRHDLSQKSLCYFLRFGDKLQSEAIKMTDAQIVAGACDSICRSKAHSLSILSDDNSRADIIVSHIKSLEPRVKVEGSFLHYRSFGYSNNDFRESDHSQQQEIHQGIENMIYNLVTLSHSSEFCGDTACNLVNTSALYAPLKFSPSLAYPCIPV